MLANLRPNAPVEVVKAAKWVTCHPICLNACRIRTRSEHLRRVSPIDPRPLLLASALRASLKEPSRPFTPTDRQLFSSAPDSGGQQRLGTSHGAPSRCARHAATPMHAWGREAHGVGVLQGMRAMHQGLAWHACKAAQGQVPVHIPMR